MEKYVRYCPFCDKYYSRWDLLCAFCIRDNILLIEWNEMTKKQKEEWKNKTKPRRSISEINPDTLKKLQKDANAFDAQYRAELEEKEHPKYTPRCPTCSSPDIEKIGTASKVLDVAFWGFASGKVKKTFHCKNCGYEW